MFCDDLGIKGCERPIGKDHICYLLGLGGGGDAPEIKPTPHEEALADVAVKEYQDFAGYYLPFERQYQKYAKSSKSPYVLRQNQFKAETPYLNRFNPQGVSPGALEPRLMQHQMELGYKQNTARQMAIPQHFENYTQQFLELSSLGRNLEINANKAQLGRAEAQSQYQLARHQAEQIRNQGKADALGTVAGLYLSYMI